MKTRIIYTLVLLSMFLLAPLAADAQNAFYDHEITESDGTYVPLTGDSYICGVGDDSSYRFNFPSGFRFIFDDQVINHVWCHQNGWISLNYNSGGPYYGQVNARFRMTITLCMRDMYVRGGITYKLEGSTGDRVLTIQYRNFSYYSNYPPYLQAQYKFYEKNNQIDIIWGGTTNSASWPNQVGFFNFVGQNNAVSWYNIKPGAPSEIYRGDEGGNTQAWMGQSGAYRSMPFMYPGKTFTYGGSPAVPVLTSIVPEDLSSWQLGNIFTADDKLPAAYVNRQPGMPSFNLEMDIYQKSDPTNIIYHAVKNNQTPESPDEDTSVRVLFDAASGDAAGAGGCFDTFTNRIDIIPGDYIVKVTMTLNDDPEFEEIMSSDIILPVANDMAVQQIVAPLPISKKIYPISGVPVMVMVRNTGVQERPEWKLTVTATDENGDVVYEEEFNYPEDDPRHPEAPALTTNETYTVDFGYFIPDNVGSFSFAAVVEFEDGTDEQPGNNRLPASEDEEDQYTVSVAHEYDVRVSRMLNPENAQEIMVQRPIKPACSFYNHGVNDASENTVICYFLFEGDTVHADTLEHVSIIARDTTRVKFEKDFAPAEVGEYDSFFKVLSVDDQRPEFKEKFEMFYVVGALEGNYTIGFENEPGEGEDPNPTNFPTIQDAVNSLYEKGVTGPVVFQLTDKVYNVGTLSETKYPALDLTSKITGVNEINTVSFKPSYDRAIERGAEGSGVTINLLTGNGVGIKFGQNPYPQNPFAVAYYAPDPTDRLSDESLPEYVNSEGCFVFDGGRNKSIRFVITTPDDAAYLEFYNVPIYLGEGSKNITITSCIFENNMSTSQTPRSKLPHTRRQNSTREFQEIDGDDDGPVYSAAIVLRSKTPIFEDDQNRLFFDTLSCDNNVISNNVISGFGYGIASMGAGPLLQELSGQYKGFYNTNNEYSGNEIYNVSHAGIFLGYEHGSLVEGNRIYNVYGTSPTLDDMADVEFGENMAVASGIMIGDAGDLDESSWNAYNSTEITIAGNEISDVQFGGHADDGGACGILVIQGQNQMVNPSSGFTYFPNIDEAFNIYNNMVWGIESLTDSHERTGVKICVVPSAEDTGYKTRKDVIVNNTIIIDDDNLVTTGDLSGITLKGSQEAVIMNNAIAVLDDEIAHAPSSDDINALVYYEGIMPGLPGGLTSNRNAFYRPGKQDPADKSGLAIYGFREYDADTHEWLPYQQDDFESLRQWRNWSKHDYNSVEGDFTGDYSFNNEKANKSLRIKTPFPTGSVLNNRGNNIDEYLTKDIDGNLRGEAGQLFDIGADEFFGKTHLQDMEVKTISEPSAYRAGAGMFSDAEYMMTTFPLDCKVVIRNSGSLDQSGVELTLKIYRENASGVFTDVPIDTVKAYADVVTAQSVEVSFDLPAVEEGRGDDKMFKTYADLRDELPSYIIPTHFIGPMESNVTPRYKFEIEIRPDENNANNTASTVVRFYIKRSLYLDMIVSAENINQDVYNATTDPGDDVEAGKLNYDRLSFGFSKLAWFTNIDNDIVYNDDDFTDSLKIDAFDRNAWEPRSVDYKVYRNLYWSDGDDKPLTRFQKWNITEYVNAGVLGYNKNMVISSQEMVPLNSFKMVEGNPVEDQEFVNNTLRSTYNSELTPWIAGTDGQQVIGVDVDRDQTRDIGKTPVLRYDWNTDGNADNTISDDPMPMCSLTDPYTNGPGLSRRAYTFIQDGNRKADDSTMGVSTVALDRTICVLGVDWRHWSDIESTVRALVDFVKENDSWVPVELTAFDAKAVSNKVNLNWTTASEVNTDRFEVERAIVENGITAGYSTIATVAAAGKSTETLNYGPIVDADVEFGGSYMYRLQMIDADGTSELSDEVLVKIGEGNNLVLGKASPSPASNKVTFNTTADANATVVVYDASGKMFVPTYNLVSGQIELDLNTFANGSYTLVVKSNNVQTTQKFTVVK